MKTDHQESRAAHPLISVVCPTYNSAVYVEDTIQSVLRQTTPPFELIVSDDGSIDQTIEVIERTVRDTPCQVSVLRNPHKGPGAARNAGILAAKGEWIAFLDSDDRWKSEKIERIAVAIQEHPETNFFCHDQYHRFLDGREEPLRLARRYQSMNVPRQLFRNCPFATSAVVCRRDLLLENGLFNEQLMSAQDYELWLRLIPQLRVHFIDEVLGWYIDRHGNITSKKRGRHFRNVVWALTHNRHHAKLRWYLAGLLRQAAIFGKNQFMAGGRKK